MPADSLYLAEQPASFIGPEAVADTSWQLSTVIVDSIGRDTVSGRIPHFIPHAEADSLRGEAFVDSTVVELPARPSGLEEGLPPMALAPAEWHGSGLIGLVVAVVICASLCSGSLLKTLKSYRTELWSLRRRPNVFDDDHTATAPMAIILAIVYIVFGGLLLYYGVGGSVVADFRHVVSVMLVFGAYYLFQRGAYSAVGYSFTTPTKRRRWLAGFSATQAFAGIAFVPLALLALFCPEWRNILVYSGLGVYVLARLIFISKGIRIFLTILARCSILFCTFAP